MSTFDLFLHTFFALAIVLIVIAVLAKLLKRGRTGIYKSSKLSSRSAAIEIISRKTLSRHNSLTVVEVEGSRFLLAITAQSVNLISPVSSQYKTEPIDSQNTLSENDFSQLLMISSSKDKSNGSPWKAAPGETPQAWDAFIEKLRGMTIRH